MQFSNFDCPFRSPSHCSIPYSIPAISLLQNPVHPLYTVSSESESELSYSMILKSWEKELLVVTTASAIQQALSFTVTATCAFQVNNPTSIQKQDQLFTHIM